MIQTQTILKVADNSGAKTVKCIGFVNNQKKINANIGDCIIVSVKSLARKENQQSFIKTNSTRTPIKKGQIFKALIIRTKKGILNRPYGHKLIFDNNAVVLINNKDELVGSRIFGPVTRELRVKNYRNILSYADRIY
jgi:large subunit ribosomal protein L14